MAVQFTAENISKEFSRKKLFEKISFEVQERNALAITGKNGSGKSTLVKILCGLLSPTTGQTKYLINGSPVESMHLYNHIGLVSPYLNLYEEFTGEENLEFISKVRGLKNIRDISGTLLEQFAIYKHRKKEVRYYSSGMKQRLKYCAALLHGPKLLILDEPQSNLDSDGIRIVRECMTKHLNQGILIFATNDVEDLNYANSVLDLNSFGK